MNNLPRTERLSYLWAAVAVGIAFGIRWALMPYAGDMGVFLLFIPAVALTAWLGGMMPGLFATLLSLGAGIGLMRLHSQTPPGLDGRIDIGLFAITAIFVASVVQGLRKALRREMVTRPVVEVAPSIPRREILPPQDRGIRAMLDNALDVGIFTMDANNIVKEWSAGAAMLTGYSRGEMVGRSADILFGEEDIAKREPAHEQLIAEATGKSVFYRWLKKKDGESFLAEGSLRVLPAQFGEPTVFIKVFADATSRFNLHEHVKEDLLQKAKDAEVLIYLMAHDMRQYTRGISNNATMLERDFGEKMPEEAKFSFGRLKENGRRMHEMVEGILEHLRLVRSPVKPSPVNLSALAEKCATDLRRHHTDCKIQFIVQPGLWVKGDEDLLQFVFVNIFENALKYAPEGRVVFGRDPTKDAFYVKDDGPGFEPQYAEKIFDLFHRLHGQEKPGTGIGLANVKRIVERHGGKIWAESEPGKGATFYFTLKAIAEEPVGTLR